MPSDTIQPGQRFGRLVTIAEAARKGIDRAWSCVCDCGASLDIRAGALRTGNTRSCGCLRREQLGDRARTHGQSGTPTYVTWTSMITRCTNPRVRIWPYYGGRGIAVCDRWRSFEAFLEDMGERPSLGHSIDRIDPNGHYEPGNCRWATDREQASNRRPRRTSRMLTAFGKTQTLAAWARETGLGRVTITQRLKRGWSIERALETSTKEAA